jgi:acetylornithine deacetylase/succinyl-diaminopimelate desuccinylase-like protein
MSRGLSVLCVVATTTLAVLTPSFGHGVQDPPPNQIRAYREAHESEILEEFAAFLSIPNVASDGNNIRKNASAVLDMMRRRGIETRLLEGGGPPAVFGELRVPGATRTLAFYAHYDGQPVDPAKWSDDPFKPTLRDGPVANGGRVIPFPARGARVNPEARLYARSASDDKAPIIGLLASLDAMRSAGIRPTSNLKFFFEGEEEAGSRHLESVVADNAKLLGADVWICADGPVHQTRKQLLYFGVRGIVSATITVYGPNRGLHSGHYGNWAPNPVMRLAKLLASMKDGEGRVLIDGFYDDVEPLGAAEMKAIDEMPRVDSDLMKEYGLAATDGGGRSLAELLTQPSLNIDGIRSEYVGAEARTIIPDRATASLDMRLVKGEDPERKMQRLVAHIKKMGYLVVSEEPGDELRLEHPLIARVVGTKGYRAVRTSMSLPVSRRVIAAVEKAIGYKPVLAPTLGGSVPLYIFDSTTHSAQIGVPIVNHDNNQHGVDENLRIQNLWHGIEIFAALMCMDWGER